MGLDMFGFYNMMIRIDVAQQAFELQMLPDDILRQNLGGKGLATHLLLKHNPPKVDPLGPENHLIFVTGPSSGTSVWGSCRYGVFTKSPQTGFFSESYSGGTVADYMAATGFDVMMLHGSATEPVWIEICDEMVYFHSANELWGMDTFATEDYVKGWITENRPDVKKSGVICIGPAGEKQVSFSVIENDYWRSAGRTGVGAVMGSKNVKAIAFWGKSKKSVADPTLLKSFAREQAQRSKEDVGVNAYKKLGTPMLVDIMNNAKAFPSHYWHKGTSSHYEQINASALHSRCEVTPNACLKCFIACGRLTTVKEGRHAGLKIEGPEYETIYAFGGLCEVDSIEEIAYLNDLCDRLGMDTISAGNLVAMTIEAVQFGKVEYEIGYGNVDAIANLIHDIAARKGIGDILAKGIVFAAKEWGMEAEAIHVKGLEPAGYDPRVLKGMGLAYGSSPRGACHLRATFYKPELSKMIDPEQIAGKAEMFTEWEDRLTIFDALILCRFYRDLYQWDELSTILQGLIGLKLTTEDMRKIAKNISDNTRIFNLREGLTLADDQLPKRFHEEFLPETNKVITKKQMDQLLSEYYQARGWNEIGKPGQET